MEKQVYTNLSKEITEQIEWLSTFGKTNTNGVTRLLYTDEWRAAQQALSLKMKVKGFHSFFDDVGNLFGRIEGTSEKDEIVMTGSHIDTVINGGKFDGAYGVIASFIAVARLVEAYGKPKKTIEVVSFCEEEGSRFPLSFWGSGSLVGAYDVSNVQHLTDAKNERFVDCMEACGFGLGTYLPPSKKRLHHFVELHIEQGQVLESAKNDIGLVTHIVGQRRYTVIINGESNHAGTTPMLLRKDCIVVFSDFVQYVTKKAKATHAGLVATVGNVIAEPNVSNVINGKVTFSLDIRHSDEQVIEHFCEDIFQYLHKTVNMIQMTYTSHLWLDVSPVKMDESMLQFLEKKATNNNYQAQLMVSGAGHDAQMIGRHVPTTLLFVPSKDGISHSPKEYTSETHLELGVKVLMDALYYLCY